MGVLGESDTDRRTAGELEREGEIERLAHRLAEIISH